MSEPVGIKIGTQEIASGSIIEPKTPSDFHYPNPQNDNLMFDTELGWTIKTNDSYDGRQLIENTTYEYGKDISVQANWRKKVQTHIWCYGHQEQAEIDLVSHVGVTGGVTDSQYNSYGFFKDDEAATFEITGSNNKVITVGNRLYTFVGWAPTVPTIFSSASNQIYESDELIFQKYPIPFSAAYLKEEWAGFLYSTEIEIIVKTNRADFNNNSKILFNYTLHGFNTLQFMFNPNNPAVVLNPSDFGNYFYCSPCLTTIGACEFTGWYLGDWNDETNPPSSYLTQQTTTPNIYAVYSPIVLTAVYLPSTNVYTISYYSGID